MPHSYDFMLGNIDIEGWHDSYYEFIAIPLFFFFSFVVVLVMLNLLIALMVRASAATTQLYGWRCCG